MRFACDGGGMGSVAEALEGGEVVVGGEQGAADEHLVREDAGSEQVGARIDLAELDVLGRHVGPLALERQVHRLHAGGGGLRDAEIDELGDAGVGDDDVGRRDVAMDDAERLAGVIGEVVRVVERVEDLVQDRERDGERHRRRGLGAAVHDQVERLALDQLHRDEVRARGSRRPRRLTRRSCDAGSSRASPRGGIGAGPRRCRRARAACV